MIGPADARADTGAGTAPASWRVTLLVVVGYVALTLWWLWPLPTQLTDHVICPTARTPFIAADLSLITWALAWDTHALLAHPLSLFDANIFHPAPLSLAFSEHFLGYVPLFAPAFLATGNPVLASNTVIVLAFPLCALAAYALARRFVAPPAAFVAGALFAFHGERYVNLYHLHQLGTFWMPLALLFTERWLERARARDASALAVAVALQLLSSFYLAYAMVLFYAAYLPCALLRWHARLDRRRWVGLVAALLAAGVPAVLASLPYLELQRLGLVPSGRSSMVDLALSPFITQGRIAVYLTTLGVGPFGYLLAVLGLVTGWRARGGYARVIALVAVLAGLLLAAGPRVTLFGRDWWSPYALLFRYLPGFSAVRLPFRFLVVAQLGFALLAGLGVAAVVRLLPVRAAWPSAVVAVALLLATSGARPPHPLVRQISPATLPPAYGWLAQHAHDGALLEFPTGSVTTVAERMVMSTFHWRPVIDGYSAYPPLTRRYLLELAAGLPATPALQELVDHVDVRWLLVHLDRLSPAERGAWLATPAGLTQVLHWGNDLLFEVTLPVANDRRELLRRTDRTLGGLEQRPLGERCPGRIEVAAPEAGSELATGKAFPVRLRIVNDGDAPLPGAGVYPRHLVQVHRTLRFDGRAYGMPVTLPLWTDVAAGQTAETTLELPALPQPGAWQVDLELVQDGDSLARCGMQPTSLAITATGPARRMAVGGDADGNAAAVP